MKMSLRAENPSLTAIFPDIPPVNRLIPVRKEPDTDANIWLRALQGLINREEPCVYVLDGGPDSPTAHWLTWYAAEYQLPVEKERTQDELLAEFAHLVSGYVVYDNKDVIQTQNIAITLCGLEGTLPVAPEQEARAAALGIPKKDDLRGRFAGNLEAARWAVAHLWPRCNRRMFGNLCVHRPLWYAMGHNLVDYLVYHRVFTLEIPRSRIFREYLDLYDEMMATAEAPGVQLGWHCIWDQEKEYVAEATKRGFFSLCSKSAPNMTIHGGIGDREKAYVQPLPDKNECKAEAGKVYVCLYNSDGDAPWAMLNLHSDNWRDKDRGAFPFGWGFLPLMVQMMPAVLEYYQKTRLANDCFFGPSSGAGYTYSFLWPDDLAGLYLSESRRLLTQSGQNGCNMVNWYLQDWWREVEDDAAVAREQAALAAGSGLVCGLGGSPFAKSYPNRENPKAHSVHIANVGRENIGDIVRLAKECKTRPLFLFLFAQIQPGIFAQLNGEMEEMARHPEIKLVSMDEFFVTMQSASEQGLLDDRLYDLNDELAETWLKAPGRHRLPLYASLTEELASTALDTPVSRRKRLADAGYTQLVSGEIENIARSREDFVKMFDGRTPPTEGEEADALFYTLFTVAFGVVRSALEAKGVYANNRFQCLADYKRLCADLADPALFEAIFDAWTDWPNGAPSVEQSVAWCIALEKATAALNSALGDEGDFAGWPPKTI